MSVSNDVLQRYRAARTRLNGNEVKNERISYQRQRPMKKRRQIFRIKKEEIKIVPSLVVKSSSFTRLYPPTVRLRPIESDENLTIDLLHEIRFLGQFDRKFVICKRFFRSSDVDRVQLIFFDQHAISERILLERLQNDFHQTKSFYFNSPLVIARNPRFHYDDEQMKILQQIGFVFSSISTKNLFIRAVPNWLRHSSLVSPTIDQILMKISSPDFFAINLNFLIYETLKSFACHNAIKFNDFLSINESTSLLEQLKLCSMPFICAHGRTSAALLCQYEQTEEIYRVNIKELEQLASIHKWMKNS